VGKDKKNSLNIWCAINKYGEQLGAETLPFAEHDSHSIYFLKWEQEQAKVCLWSEASKQITLISDSFDAFLEILIIE
jgi:hypothetical protein